MVSKNGLSLPFGDSYPREQGGSRKKATKLPALSETLIEPDASDEDATVLELDELWSFVAKKTRQAWIWIALCRKTRQVVAYAVGDRSEATCRCLWEAIPPAVSYRSLLHRFLDCLSSRDSRRPTHRCWKGNGRNRSRRTLEQYTSAALGSFCSQNSFIL
jgi:IS1 family transposase